MHHDNVQNFSHINESISTVKNIEICVARILLNRLEIIILNTHDSVPDVIFSILFELRRNFLAEIQPEGLHGCNIIQVKIRSMLEWTKMFTLKSRYDYNFH